MAQIELMANMCLGRSYNCIHVLEKLYPYTTLTALISQMDLPPPVKGAFCELLRGLWIDRFPHTAQQLPKKDWIVSDMHLLPTTAGRQADKPSSNTIADCPLSSFELSPTHQLLQHSDPFYSFANSDKFYLVINFVSRSL